MSLSTLTEELAQLTKDSSFMFAVFDTELRLQMANEQFYATLGLTSNNQLQKTLPQLLPRDMYQSIQPYLDKVTTGSTVQGEMMLQAALPNSYHFCLTPIQNQHNSSHSKQYGFLFQGVDITEKHQLLDSLQESQRYYQNLISMLEDGFCILENGVMVSANESTARILGVTSSQQLLGKHLQEFLRDPHSGNIPEQLHQQLSLCQQHILNTAPAVGMRKRISLQSVPITTMGNVAQMVIIRSDEHLPDDLQQRDPLTGLLNRHSTLRQLQSLIRSDIPLSMLYLDLDNFKNINDSLGHHIGDKVLVEIASRLRNHLPENAILGYFGGDEFGIILPNTNKDAAKQYGLSLIRIVKNPLSLPQVRKHISCSIGCVVYPGDGNEAHHLLQHANTAMYDAKDHGRNKLTCYQSHMNREARLRLWLEVELQKALTKSELEVYYQPKVNTRDFRLTGMEALVRWKHSTEGFISPARFISVAEKAGLIDWLGRVVMEKVFATVQRWLKQGLNPGQVSINLSPQQFANAGLLNEVLALKRHYQIPSNRIILEITENAVMTDQQHAANLLHTLRAEGFNLSIDDFGTGYSSLSYLANFPFDELKIDRSFISDILHNPKQVAIVESIINLGKSLNMHVIMEGVETHEEATLIAGLNCDGIQGYHFFKPMAADEVEKLLSPSRKIASAVNY